MSFLEPKNKEQEITTGLLAVKNNDELFNRMTVLQNEISVAFSTKVTAVVGVKNDKLAAVFAKAFADTYSRNGSSVLLIDANLYNPCLEELLGNKQEDNVEFKDNDSSKEFKITNIDEKTDAVYMGKEIYPSVIYKAGAVQRLIKDNENKYEHFVVIMPSIKEHKEIALIADVTNSIILVSQKNVTLKKHIFDAIQFLKVNNLPLAKTVVLK